MTNRRLSLRARIPDADIWRIYATILALGVAYGVALSLIAIFLDERGFGKEAIGTLAAWFALGIVAMSIPAGVLIRRLSAKTTLVLALFGYAVAVSAFPFTHSYAGAGVARFFDGAFSVAVWVSSETILLTRAPRENKAFVTSLYAISLAVGYVLGPIVARGFVAIAPLRLAFVLAGAIAVGAALFVALRLSGGVGGTTHVAGARSTTPARQVFWRIKTSCFATFAYGYFQASVVLFLPLFLMQERGIAKEQTIVIPAFFAAGMLVFASFAGRLGDRVGHLTVMRALGAVGLCMILGFAWLRAYPAMCIAVFVAGATLASISPVSLALSGLSSAPEDTPRATAIYNAFYAAGMLIGPPVSGALFAKTGGAPMLYHLAGIWLAFVGFTWLFRADDPAVLGPDRAAPRATPIGTS